MAGVQLIKVKGLPMKHSIQQVYTNKKSVSLAKGKAFSERNLFENLFSNKGDVE